MAHDPLHICTPQNAYGPFEQTQFLGCSVLSFTANAGVNEQGSEITVELVQDPCISEKIYFPTHTVGSWAPTTHIEADPGFTEPIVGAPCYFRVADFEFAGLMQSWTKKEGPDGYPTYTVKLTDPRVLLDNIQLILSDYQGGIQGLNPTFPNFSLVNIVNVYGFLDSLVPNCPLVKQSSTSFGALAGGWGYSSANQAGVPWNLIKDATQVLLGNNATSPAPKFSKGWIYGPPGRLKSAPTPGPPPTPARGGYGEIYTGGGLGNLANPAKYILDLTEIPYAPIHYRISGPIISVSELISQACRDAGCDYYVELLPTSTALVIKVRVIVRRVQPAMTEIAKFIKTKSQAAAPGFPPHGTGTVNKTIGREYRPNPNNAFIIGDKVRSVYLHSGLPVAVPSGSGFSTTGMYRTIQPYWGRDLDGRLNMSYESTCEVTDTGNPDHWLGPPDWNVRLDFRDLQGLLDHKMTDDSINPRTSEKYKAWRKLMPDGRGWVLEGELRAALGSMQDFINFVLQPHPYCTDTDDGTVLRLWANDLALDYQAYVPSKLNSTTPGGIAVTGGAPPPGAQSATVQSPIVSFLSAINQMGGSKMAAGAASGPLRDVQKVHQWLQKYAKEHYGRKWLVEIPFTCWAGDTGNPKKIRWSDEPSPEGGWTDQTGILNLDGLGDPRTNMARFKTDDGRVLPMLRWTQNAPRATPICGRNPCVTGLDYSRVPQDNMVTDVYNAQPSQGPDLYVWQKAELHDQWVTGSPYSGSNQNRAFALLTCDPITTGFPINDGKRAPTSFLVRSGLRDIEIKSDGEPMVGIAGRYGDRMIHPLAAAVPVLSNTQTYGPWYKQAIMVNASESYGTVHAEQDTTLNPWEWGGTSSMNSGALVKLENSTTIMNAAERGEVTVPGYPTMGLGAGITATNSIASTRTLLSSGLWGFTYDYVKLPVSHSSASVSNMNVVVSPQGVTTSYTITTFTPVFGRFSKGNADRIKEIGQNRLREERKRAVQRGKDLARRGGMGNDVSSASQTELSEVNSGPAYAQNSAGILLGGRLSKHDERRKEVLVTDKNSLSFYGDYKNTALMSIDGLFRPVSKTGALNPGQHFNYTIPGLPAMKSYSDTLCPATGFKAGNVEFEPVYTGTVSGGFVYSGLTSGVTYKNLHAPISPPPPIPHFSGIIVTANYLDPLADYVSNPKFMSGMRATGSLGTGISGAPLYPYASGHDVEIVARGDLSGLGRLDSGPWSGESMIIAGESGRYGVGTTLNNGLPSESGSGNYRFMALKGPIVLQSWGYDTYGKPIPNSRGWSGDVTFDTGVVQELQTADMGNTHQRGQSGLTDRFAPNWLSNATNWPVAPVDLRFDRARGVWTTPPPFRLQRVIALESFKVGETGVVELLTGGDMYNEDGLAYKDIPYVTGSGSSGLLYGTGVPPVFRLTHIADVNEGDIMVTHYDTYTCEHWVVGGGGAGGGGVDGDIPAIGDFVCEGDIITATSTTLSFSNGLLVGTG